MSSAMAQNDGNIKDIQYGEVRYRAGAHNNHAHLYWPEARHE